MPFEIKRKIHRVEIHDNVFYVRELTRADVTNMDAIELVLDKSEYAVRVGLCNEHGMPVLSDDDDLASWPLPMIMELADKIATISVYQKKVSPTKTESCGDLPNSSAKTSGD